MHGAGGGQGSSSRAWVGEQTAILAGDGLAIRVGGHTQLDGSVLASGTGNLSLDTGTLGFSSILDHDRGRSANATLGLTLSRGPDGQAQATTPQGASTGLSLSGEVESHDRERITRATVGDGTIAIRDSANQAQDVAALNRDLTKAQEITRDDKAGVKFYASDSSIRAAIEVLEKVGTTLKDAFSASVESRKDIDPETKRAAGNLIEDMLSGKVKPEDVRGCIQQGFNLHNLLFTPAYASGACGAYSVEAIKLCFSFIDNMRAGFVEKGADFVDLFKRRMQEDPQGFENIMKLINATPTAAAMAPLEEAIKQEILKNGDDVKAITDAVGSYLADQQQKLANGEISNEVALATTIGALIVTYKITPKSIRNQVLDKARDIAGDVLNLLRPADKAVLTRLRVSGFDVTESKIIVEAKKILSSREMQLIREAQKAGQPITVRIRGREVQFEPDAPTSGITNFETNGFLIGREAFSRGPAELEKTVLHELYRLYTSKGPVEGFSGELARREVDAAFAFAEKAYGHLP
jgi:hypothetical protein